MLFDFIKFQVVWNIYFVSEYAGNIGDAKDPEAREKEQDRIMQLVDKFLWTKSTPPALN